MNDANRLKKFFFLTIHVTQRCKCKCYLLNNEEKSTNIKKS